MLGFGAFQVAPAQAAQSYTFLYGHESNPQYAARWNRCSTIKWGVDGALLTSIGVNVPAEKFLAAAREHKADILAMSALLTTTVVNMKEVIELFKKDGFPAKVLIGGAPVTDGFARQIGADGYSRNASLAVDTAKVLIGKVA